MKYPHLWAFSRNERDDCTQLYELHARTFYKARTHLPLLTPETGTVLEWGALYFNAI